MEQQLHMMNNLKVTFQSLKKYTIFFIASWDKCVGVHTGAKSGK